jgi:hypothetical protein
LIDRIRKLQKMHHSGVEEILVSWKQPEQGGQPSNNTGNGIRQQCAMYQEIFEAEHLPIVYKYQISSREVSRKIGRQRKQAA